MLLIPAADGQPALKGQRIEAAQCAGKTLALLINGGLLRLFDLSRAKPLCELPQPSHPTPFMLSSDGRLLARRLPGERIEVCPTGGGQRLLVTRMGGFHGRVDVELGNEWVSVRVGRYSHVFHCDIQGRIRSQVHPPDGTADDAAQCRLGLVRPTMLPDLVGYDRRRFVGAVRNNLLTAVTDCFGHVLLFDPAGTLLGIMFVWRNLVGIWGPDGTRYGPASLTGAPATPKARQQLATGIHQATWGWRWRK